MKRKMTFLVALFIATVSLSAQTFVKNGVHYKVTDAEAKTVEVTTDWNPGTYTGGVIIPASVKDDGGVTYAVTAIGNWVFQNTAIISIELPEGLLHIGEQAFHTCVQLTNIVIPNTVKTIGTDADDSRVFVNCTELVSITLGTGLESIGTWAFGGCTKLMTVTCLAQTPPAGDKWPFDFGDPDPKTLYVPQGTRDAYLAVEPWWSFGTIEEFEATSLDEQIAEQAFVRQGNNLLFDKVTPIRVFNTLGQMLYQGNVKSYALPNEKGVYLLTLPTASYKLSN